MKRPSKSQYYDNVYDSSEQDYYLSGEVKIADYEYNLKKMLQLRLTHYYEAAEKESLESDLMNNYKLCVLKDSHGSPAHVDDEELTRIRESIKLEQWDLLIRELHRAKMALENGYIPKSMEILILATEPTDDLINDNAYLKDVVVGLNSYFKEILVSFILNKKVEMTKYLMKCIEILDLAVTLKRISDKERLEPIKLSNLEQVDTFEGRPVYKVK